MVAFNFKGRFIKGVESGEKRQTIRADRKDHREPCVGVALQLYTGMMTKQCRKLMDAVCTSVETVIIDEDGTAKIGYHDLDRDTFDALAVADGFDSGSDLIEWISITYGFPFRGILIKW